MLAEQQPGGVAAISAKLVDMLLEDSESERDAFKISDYILRCIPALLGRPNRQTYINNLVSAGSQAFSRGALEVGHLPHPVNASVPTMSTSNAHTVIFTVL